MVHSVQLSLDHQVVDQELVAKPPKVQAASKWDHRPPNSMKSSKVVEESRPSQPTPTAPESGTPTDQIRALKAQLAEAEKALKVMSNLPGTESIQEGMRAFITTSGENRGIDPAPKESCYGCQNDATDHGKAKGLAGLKARVASSQPNSISNRSSKNAPI